MIKVMDIETNGLLGEWEDGVADRIHCVVFGTLDGTYTTCVTKEQFTQQLEDCTVLVCHNMLDYDLPLLLKLGWLSSYTVEPDTINGHQIKLVDTLILSRLFNPERNGHGLAQWGEQLGVAKPQIDDWDNQTLDDYIHRCIEDVKINEKVFKVMCEYGREGNWTEAVRLEKAFQDCVHRSENYGMFFDVPKAKELEAELNERMEAIEAEVNAALPERDLPASQVKMPPKVRFKKDGTPSAHAKRYFGDYLVDDDGAWIVDHPNGHAYPLGYADIPPVVTKGTMLISNQADLKQHLLNIGWRPTHWNIDKETKEKKSPRLNDPVTKDICPNLEKLGEKFSWVLKLTEWLVLRHRRNLLRGNGNAGLLNHPRLDIDSRLPAGMVTIGAGTHRVTHRTVANLPRVSTLYGREIRSLFAVPRGRSLVGFDASALEDRLKGHYTYKYDGGEYARKINDPEYDAHTESADLWGISRSDAKTGNYALQFGAGVPKFAAGLGVDIPTGQRYYQLWWDNNAGLRDFRDAATHYWEKHGSRYVLGLDGRRVPCDTAHKVTNRIIQSAGAIVMKRATVIFDRLIKKEGLDAHMTEFYHDELVVECDPAVAERVLQLGIKSIRMAGKAYNLAVDLDADGDIGQNWGDIH